MRCLVVAPEIEDPQYRGIQAIVRHMLKSAHSSGIEVYLLTGHLTESAPKLLPSISKRVDFIYLKHYLTKGVNSFKLIARHFNALKVAYGFFMNFFRKLRTIEIKHDTEYQDVPLLNYVDKVVALPYIYQFVTKGYTRVITFLLRRITKKYKIDFILTSGPLRINKLNNGTKLVQFIHDFIPLLLTEDPMENHDVINFAKRMSSAIRNSDLLLANSESTKKYIHEIDDSKDVEVLYGGFSSFAKELQHYENNSSILSTYGLENEGYYLFVCPLEKRKNVLSIAKAFVTIADQSDKKLILAGREGYKTEELTTYIKSLPKTLQKRILLPGSISEHDKVTLHKHALAVVFPSFFEGFGIPVLEALSHGCPTITTRVGGIPEIADDAAYYIDNPYSEAELSQAMLAVLNDQHLRNRLRAQGPDKAKKFTEEAFQEKFVHAISKLNPA